MGQRGNYVAKNNAQNVLSEEVYVRDTRQSLNDAVVKNVVMLLGREECAGDMGQRRK